MLASDNFVCAYAHCEHLGGMINAGSPYTWDRRAGTPAPKYHPECYARFAMVRDIPQKSVTAPVPVVQPKPVQAPASASSDLERAQALLELLQGPRQTPIDRNAVLDICAEYWHQVAAPVRFVVERPELPSFDAGIQHKFFDRLLYFANMRESLYVWGPAGTGKTSAAVAAAEALGLDHALISLNAQSPASKLEGFIDAHGKFTNPDFFRLYSDGGIFIIDEIDNGSGNLLASLNSALANGTASFPCGNVARHPDFVCIATANTSGRGGNHLHPERRKLDGATLDRFSFLFWPADETLELATARGIAGENGEKWAKWVQAVRTYCDNPACGVSGGVYASFRAIISGCKFIATRPAWMSVSDIAETTVFKGLPADMRSRITSACTLPEVK